MIQNATQHNQDSIVIIMSSHLIHDMILDMIRASFVPACIFEPSQQLVWPQRGFRCFRALVRIFQRPRGNVLTFLDSLSLIASLCHELLETKDAQRCLDFLSETLEGENLLCNLSMCSVLLISAPALL